MRRTWGRPLRVGFVSCSSVSSGSTLSGQSHGQNPRNFVWERWGVGGPQNQIPSPDGSLILGSLLFRVLGFRKPVPGVSSHLDLDPVGDKRQSKVYSTLFQHRRPSSVIRVVLGSQPGLQPEIRYLDEGHSSSGTRHSSPPPRGELKTRRGDTTHDPSLSLFGPDFPPTLSLFLYHYYCFHYY